MILVDSHCHLEGADTAAAEEILARARAAGLVHAVVVGQLQAPGDFGAALQVAASASGFLSPTMGIHPHDAAKASAEDFEMLARHCALPEVVAVGETGLDYYYDNSPRAEQGALFRKQCALSLRVRKPLVVHVRDAHRSCCEILESEGVSAGMIHCFTGTLEDARRYLDLGFFISVSGIVTYKKTDALQEAVKFAPLDRLLIETDSPYLAPVPFRGRKNEPAWVSEVAKKVAELKGMDPDELALATAKNSAALFGFRLPASDGPR
jgi:TatD DNase family protein